MVEDLIQEGSRFTANHPGLPISYTTSFSGQCSCDLSKTVQTMLETKVTAYRNGEIYFWIIVVPIMLQYYITGMNYPMIIKVRKF